MKANYFGSKLLDDFTHCFVEWCPVRKRNRHLRIKPEFLEINGETSAATRPLAEY